MYYLGNIIDIIIWNNNFKQYELLRNLKGQLFNILIFFFLSKASSSSVTSLQLYNIERKRKQVEKVKITFIFKDVFRLLLKFTV